MSLTSILVLGPTGGFGQFVLNELIRRKTEFKRIAAFVDRTREHSRAKSNLLETFATKGVELVKGSPTESAVYQGFDVVIAILGNHAIRNQLAQIDAAVAAGVRHWYPSEFGADLTVTGNWEERYYRDKVITRNYLQQKAAEVEGFGYTYVIYGRFTEWAPLPYFGIYPKQGKANIVGSPDMLQSLTPAKIAASYLVATLLVAPTESERTFKFVGGNYSWTTIFETLGKVQGATYDVKYRPVDEARDKQKKAIEIGDVDLELACSHQVIQGTGRTLVPAPYDNDKFPDIVPTGLETTFRKMFEDENMRTTLGLNSLFSEVV
ncbi:Isoflavone reductase-like protein [Lachnellula occidentalis]|uniref:Isoflavone reductase-like protein n=1 Tax=Lachnellula occidentalis TaxID=215460 RepID=A0A8H8S0Y5_9HELO|nr:Isoflavone reductase-like protein [Lachnellula occidentalis]